MPSVAIVSARLTIQMRKYSDPVPVNVIRSSSSGADSGGAPCTGGGSTEGASPARTSLVSGASSAAASAAVVPTPGGTSAGSSPESSPMFGACYQSEMIQTWSGRHGVSPQPAPR